MQHQESPIMTGGAAMIGGGLIGSGGYPGHEEAGPGGVTELVHNMLGDAIYQGRKRASDINVDLEELARFDAAVDAIAAAYPGAARTCLALIATTRGGKFHTAVHLHNEMLSVAHAKRASNSGI